MTRWNGWLNGRTAFFFGVAVFLFVFFTQVHPLVIYDGDDWRYVAYTQVPLSIASFFGLGMTGVSFAMLIVIVLRKLLVAGSSIDGWAFIVCIILFVGGIQIFCLGIMGQYIAKIYIESKHRPHYIVAESNVAQLTKIR